MNDLMRVCEECLNENLIQMIISNRRKSGMIRKVTVKPCLIAKQVCFQFAIYDEKQVKHKNLDAAKSLEEIQEYMEKEFKQIEIVTQIERITALVSKKGKATIKRKSQSGEQDRVVNLSHNREKQYLLKEGTPVPFLIDLGVQTKDGRVSAKMYHKFRQINRFLELIQDVLPALDKEKDITILDFGCGKSYLTFAMYYFFHELKGYQVKMIGLDLKKEVIERCNQLCAQYGYENLEFLVGDIKSYDGCQNVDMVVTLHACDTATDYALAKAVEWNAKVILSVPCCQHEANLQIKNEQLNSILKYGILKERISALITDGIRANVLEQYGYETQVLEFIDLSHTPKNLMIRAIRKEEKKSYANEVENIQKELHLDLTLPRLLKKEKYFTP